MDKNEYIEFINKINEKEIPKYAKYDSLHKLFNV